MKKVYVKWAGYSAASNTTAVIVSTSKFTSEKGAEIDFKGEKIQLVTRKLEGEILKNGDARVDGIFYVEGDKALLFLAGSELQAEFGSTVISKNEQYKSVTVEVTKIAA